MSWNQTCSISKLPIYSGDKVIIFPVKVNFYNKCSVLPFKMIGIYDDFGSFETKEQSNFNQFVNYFKEDFISNQNEYLSLDNFNYFIAEAMERQIFLKDSAWDKHYMHENFIENTIKCNDKFSLYENTMKEINDNSKLSFIFIRENIYNELLKSKSLIHRTFKEYNSKIEELKQKKDYKTLYLTVEKEQICLDNLNFYLDYEEEDELYNYILNSSIEISFILDILFFLRVKLEWNNKMFHGLNSDEISIFQKFNKMICNELKYINKEKY